MSNTLRLMFSCAVALALVSLVSCSGDDGKGGGGRASVGVARSSTSITANHGGMAGPRNGAHVSIPAGALAANAKITVAPGRSIPLPDGLTWAGPAVEATPDGTSFGFPATVAVPVNPALVPDGRELTELSVYRREASGEICPAPVLGYDPHNLLLFCATRGFTTFQAVVPKGQFAFVPRTSLLAYTDELFELTLSTTRGTSPLTFKVDDVIKVDGVTDSDSELADNEVAPGIFLNTANGTLRGAPQELGSWSFTVSVEDSDLTGPKTAVISLTITVAEEHDQHLPADSADHELVYTYDDAGNLFALGRTGQFFTLVKVPPAETDPTTTARFLGGASPALAVSPDGARVVVTWVVNVNDNPYNQQVVATEFDGAGLQQLILPTRVDSDPVVDEEEPDETLHQSIRVVNRPGVAFALDRGSEDAPESYPYLVAYEVMRNVDTEGALRADIRCAWRAVGGTALSTETRLDTTDEAGDSSGDRVMVAGTAAGCLVLWTERGGDNGGTNGQDSEGNAILGSPGEVMAITLTVPGESEDGPVDVEPGQPGALNAEATTTAIHPNVTVSPDNQFYAVWTERDDAQTTVGGEAAASTAGRGSQRSAILFRRDLSLRVAQVNGNAAASTFTANEAPLDSSVVGGAVAVNEDGQIAVAWIEAFHNTGTGTAATSASYFRRFSTFDEPIENPIELSIAIEPLLAYDNEGRLAIGWRDGGFVRRLKLQPDEPVEEEP